MAGNVTEIHVWVPGLPVGQPRARATSFRGGRPRMYDPGNASGWKTLIALRFQPYRPDEPWAGPLSLSCTFVFPRPRDHSLRGHVREGAPRWHTNRPDIDNCLKAVMDCLTGIGLWKDDTQVVEVVAKKEYVGWSSEDSGAYITVKRLTNTPDVRQ